MATSTDNSIIPQPEKATAKPLWLLAVIVSFVVMGIQSTSLTAATRLPSSVVVTNENTTEMHKKNTDHFSSKRRRDSGLRHRGDHRKNRHRQPDRYDMTHTRGLLSSSGQDEIRDYHQYVNNTRTIHRINAANNKSTKSFVLVSSSHYYEWILTEFLVYVVKSLLSPFSLLFSKATSRGGPATATPAVPLSAHENATTKARQGHNQRALTTPEFFAEVPESASPSWKDEQHLPDTAYRTTNDTSEAARSEAEEEEDLFSSETKNPVGASTNDNGNMDAEPERTDYFSSLFASTSSLSSSFDASASSYMKTYYSSSSSTSAAVTSYKSSSASSSSYSATVTPYRSSSGSSPSASSTMTTSYQSSKASSSSSSSSRKKPSQPSPSVPCKPTSSSNRIPWYLNRNNDYDPSTWVDEHFGHGNGRIFGTKLAKPSRCKPTPSNPSPIITRTVAPSRMAAPSTRRPSSSPKNSGEPSSLPSGRPTVNAAPSVAPSSLPTQTAAPSNMRNSLEPSSVPISSIAPSVQQSNAPTTIPSTQPSQVSLTPAPSASPSTTPSSRPSVQTSAPTLSFAPSASPGTTPSSRPSVQTSAPTLSFAPSAAPTATPSDIPSSRIPAPTLSPAPSVKPTTTPSNRPSSQTGVPTLSPAPSDRPTIRPSVQPSTNPSVRPTTTPGVITLTPSALPTSLPSARPSARKSAQPSNQSSTRPSTRKSAQPSTRPSVRKSAQPSTQPSIRPSTRKSSQPSIRPSVRKSAQPSNQPSIRPSVRKSAQPSKQPSTRPSLGPTPTIISARFDIELLNIDGQFPEWDATIRRAADRWEQVIVGDLFDVAAAGGDLFNGLFGTSVSQDVDDILIGYDYRDIDGQGNALALGQPTAVLRNRGTIDYFIPHAGAVFFDQIDMAQLDPNNDDDVRDVFLISIHEIGHALGFGPFFPPSAPLGGICANTCPAETLAYNCPNGQDKFDDIFPGQTLLLNNETTACGHLNPSLFEGLPWFDIMSPRLLNNKVGLLTAITVGIMEDLGYTVNYSAADNPADVVTTVDVQYLSKTSSDTTTTTATRTPPPTNATTTDPAVDIDAASLQQTSAAAKRVDPEPGPEEQGTNNASPEQEKPFRHYFMGSLLWGWLL
ncbi:hypothetical protein ACA910_009640 [Epithemia clementina (nom. ined.)]